MRESEFERQFCGHGIWATKTKSTIKSKHIFKICFRMQKQQDYCLIIQERLQKLLPPKINI